MYFKKTKIVCTMGPATDRPGVIEGLLDGGMNVARLNFSHGSHEEHAGRIKRIKQVRQETEMPLAIMLDTKGPEIRTGDVEGGKVEVHEGGKLTLTTESIVGDASRISISYEGLPGDLSEGDMILIDDGLIGLSVETIEETEIHCRVINGGTIGSKKSINVPGVSTNLPGLTEKDEADLIFGIKHGVDYVAASFIRKPQDVIAIRKVLDNNAGSDIHIISKIENREGVENIDRILAVSDGIMVARGDLGVEIPAEDVPLVQKSIIKKCNALGKPVITATQMLDSMIRNPRPTRAEVGDVANAVFDGTDAVMLSGETAAGDYPIEAVKTMANIAIKIETSDEYRHHIKPEYGEMTITNAVGESVVQLAENLNAKAIISGTASGYTPRMLSKYRPECPIFCVSNSYATVRRVCLNWGVYGMYHEDFDDADEMVMDIVNIVASADVLKTGDLIVFAAGVPLGIQGDTNLIKVHIVGNALLSGVGVGGDKPLSGIVRLSTGDLSKFQEGDILVTNAVTSNIMTVLDKAAAVIITQSGENPAADHISGDYGIPVIKNVSKAMDVLSDGKQISIDPASGLIYQGLVHLH